MGSILLKYCKKSNYEDLSSHNIQKIDREIKQDEDRIKYIEDIISRERKRNLLIYRYLHQRRSE